MASAARAGSSGVNGAAFDQGEGGSGERGTFQDGRERGSEGKRRKVRVCVCISVYVYGVCTMCVCVVCNVEVQ